MNKFILFTIIGIFSLVTIVNCYKNYSSLISCTKIKRNPRIIGGSDTIKGEIPFIVSLTRRGGHFCGASILNEKWLITAAHCICDGFNNILKATRIKGIVGLHQFSEFKRDDKTTARTTDDKGPFEIGFKNFVKHPRYDCTKTNDDIALLELIKPLNFNDYVKPVCVTDDRDNSFDRIQATVSGWGWTDENQENGIRADILQKASVKVWNNEKCQDSYQMNGKNMIVSSTQMCAGYEDGRIDSCWADSGGPLVIEKNILIGIVSTGIGCARPGLPGIYTRVSEYTKWIESVIFEQN